MSELVKVSLPNGDVKQAPKGITVFEFIRDHIGPGLAKAAVFAKFGGAEVDLAKAIEVDGALQVFTSKNPEALEVARHDAAHIVADAVQRLFPGTQVTIGPAIEEGFYYDFYREKPFTPEDLEKIEAKANEIIAADLPFRREEISMEAAVELFKAKGEKFKVEIVNDIAAKGAKTLTLYRHGDWVDFCLGPHGPSTGKVGVIKILSSSGAYWRGDHRNPMLQRVYGIAFFDKKALEAWVKQREEAAKRDHRKLGKELDLFHFHPFSPGAAYWTEKGTTLYSTLQNYMRRLTKAGGYLEIKTPLLYNKGLWEISGHWDKYRENLFLVQDSESGELNYGLKPMNCPSHHLLYAMKKHSYRDLPLRYHSQDVLHRNEAAGAMSGLTRVRQFAQDDAHIYLREDQLPQEMERFVSLLNKVYADFGLTYSAKFSTRPAQRLGSDETWDKAEGAIEQALKALKVEFEVAAGDGAFYGPKLDFKVNDSIGRSWQLGTLQVDYIAAERFDLSYVGEDNKPHRPVVLHRAIFGSFERFIAILVEHYAGAFPTWLAPVQVVIVTVADRQATYANEVLAKLEAAGLRAEIDDRGLSMQKKIAEAQVGKTPFTLVIGDREVEQGAVAPRRYGGEDLKSMPLGQFIELALKEAVAPSQRS
jgi:threonyl-tRNA synthetase